MVRPCSECGGSGEFPPDHDGATGYFCPRCEGMPKMPPRTLGMWGGHFRASDDEIAVRGQAFARGWFRPDPDTVMWWCVVYRQAGDGLYRGDCDVCGSDPVNHDCGWVARPERLEEVE